jgi:hypothetical protein|tara:strand:- start:61 stop:363 length:303 start_codon:yes stop_codon:yes gene_type:complete
LAWFGIGLYSHNLADEYKKQVKNNWKLFLIASLTVGLAPFSLPYILGKIQWILGGNAFSSESGMQGQNWFDVLLHGLPWILLLISILLDIFGLLKKKDSQ